MSTTNHLLIIDGHALMHRAYHAIPPLTTSRGEAVNAVYGFETTLNRLLKELSPTHLAIVFDAPGETWRDSEFSDYKAQRDTPDDELISQFDLTEELARAHDYAVFRQNGIEADDIIGALAQKATDSQPNLKVTIASGDLDLVQLVNKQVSIYQFRRGLKEARTITLENCHELTGLRPEEIRDFKALSGDPSDNIPGVKGIGEKTALALIAKYQNLEKILEAAKNESENITKGVREKLIREEKTAILSQKIATIDPSVFPLKLDGALADLALPITTPPTALKIFERLEFFSLLNKQKNSTDYSSEKNTDPANREVIWQKSTDQTFLNKTVFIKEVVIGNGEPGHSRPIELVYLENGGQAGHISWPKEEKSKQHLKKLFGEAELIVGHELKKLLLFALWDDFKIEGNFFDLGLSSYVLSSGEKSDLGALCQKYRLTPPTTPNTGSLLPPPKEETLTTLFTYEKLFKKIKPELDERSDKSIFYDLETPLIPILAQTERYGMKIDQKFFSDLKTELSDDIKKIEKKIFEEAGTVFNILSSVQMRKILFERLHLPTTGIKKGKTGLSTAQSELDKLRGQHPIIEYIEEYRELAKLDSTYVSVLPRLVNHQDGRIHTSFNQTVAATGRLSSSDPNLQNIPIRTPYGEKVRRGFVSENGYTLVSADYSQIELRIAAHLSGDQKMQEIFRKNEDFHTATAAAINGVPLDKVTKEMRHAAKEVNFGILYGMRTFGLASRTHIALGAAEDFISAYFTAFPGLKNYLKETVRMAEKTGFTETMFGRRRYLPELNAKNHQIRAAGERMAVNMPIQGTNADIIKKAMLSLEKKLLDKENEVRLVCQVHDELLFEIKNDQIVYWSKIIRETMSSCATLVIPLVVNIKSGPNWADLVPLEI